MDEISQNTGTTREEDFVTMAKDGGEKESTTPADNATTTTTQDASLATDRSIDSGDWDSADFADGEIKILLESVQDEEEEAPVPEAVNVALRRSFSQIVGLSEEEAEKALLPDKQAGLSMESAYGIKLTPEKAAELVPPGEGGLVRRNQYDEDKKNCMN